MSNKQKIEEELKTRGINPLLYSLDESKGYYVDYACCLRQVYGKWTVFYTERREYIDEKEFDNENEACEYFIKLIL